jgi:competence protein ComEC
MFRWTPYVFVRFTLYLIVGILTYQWLPHLPVYTITAGIGICFLCYWALWLMQRKRQKKWRLHVWFGSLALLIISGFGWLLSHYQTQANQPEHILHQTGIAYYTGKIVSEVQTRSKNYRSVLAVDKIVSDGMPKPATGKILLYTSLDAPKPVYGDRLLIYGAPQQLKPPANPGEFDYQQYLSLQQIHLQQFIKKGKFHIYQHHAGNPVLAASLRVRSWADSVFRQHIRGVHEYAIVSGLVLGIRDGLDNDLKNAYAAAGAMHVLAVSGAHVIIVFQLIVFLLGRLKKVRSGNWLFALAALLVLWFYAFVTGLSASVLRAVIMFSFVVIGESARREGNLFNTLGLSAFLLLCYDPYLLQDVGFQLSYLAVAGIVYLYPKLYRWFDFQNRIVDTIWESTCVSLAAQVAVLPLTLFYFHQFPTYFLFANLLMIPISGGILYAGLGLLATAWIPYLSDGVSFLVQWLTWLMNQVAFWTERTPGALLQGIYLNTWELGLLYVWILLVLLFFYWPRLRVWSVATLVLTYVTVSQGYGKVRYRDQRLLAVYAIPGHATLDIMEGSWHIFLADSALLANENRILFHLRNHWGNRHVLAAQKILFSQIQATPLAIHHTPGFSIFTWHGKRFCILHQPIDLRQFRHLTFNYLIVQNNSLRNARNVPQTVFTHVILDSSNRYYAAKRLQNELRQQNIRCHNVHEDGAFLLSLAK